MPVTKKTPHQNQITKHPAYMKTSMVCNNMKQPSESFHPLSIPDIVLLGTLDTMWVNVKALEANAWLCQYWIFDVWKILTKAFQIIIRQTMYKSYLLQLELSLKA